MQGGAGARAPPGGRGAFLGRGGGGAGGRGSGGRERSRSPTQGGSTFDAAEPRREASNAAVPPPAVEAAAPPPEPEVEAEVLHVLLAACAGRGGDHVGLAYVDLDAQERVLYVAEVFDPSFQELQRLKHALLGDGRRRGLCVLPSRSPAELQARAAEPLLDPAEATAFPVTVLKAGDFELEPCRQALRRLRVEDGLVQVPDELYSTALELRGRSVLDLDNEELVRAAGGLVRYMEKNRSHLGDLDDPGQPLHVHSVRLFAPESLLCVDAQTMAALEVFRREHHPSLVRGIGRSKEGLSLYGLMEPFVASPAGRSTLRRWLQQPSRNVRLLLARQDAVEELSGPRRREFLREFGRELREVRDIAALLRRVFGCYHFDNVHDWSSLMSTLEHMSAAFSLLQNESFTIELDAFRNVGELVADVAATEDMLRGVLDLSGSAGRSEVRVRRGVDEKLDAVHRQYEQIDTYLTEVARLERRRLAEMGHDRSLANSLAFHYFPQLGFHVSVPNPLSQGDGTDGDAKAMEMLKRDVAAPVRDWKYQFASSGRLFYKCPLAVRLDSEIGDLVVAARELELELLLGVVERLRRFERRLCRAAQVLADLDVLVGFALVAGEHNWRRPKLVSNEPGKLYISRGRHPLAEANLSAHHSFVPNDTTLGKPPKPSRAADDEEESSFKRSHRDSESIARVQVVTGANLSGKSVYLKQVGLIVLLAQIGSFVPAADAELGLCDFIFSRIQNCEGAAVRCSTFGIDVTQVARALRHATEASLMLLDEFGKGTHAADGVALLGATLEHLCYQRGPKAIVTTHFFEVFRFGLVPRNAPGLMLSTLRVLLPDVEGSSAAYLYQIVSGIAEQSLGLECAKRAGMQQEVLERAEEIQAALERGQLVPVVGEAHRTDGHQEDRSAAAEMDLELKDLINRLRSMNPDDAGAAKELVTLARRRQQRLDIASAAGAGA